MLRRLWDRLAGHDGHKWQKLRKDGLWVEEQPPVAPKNSVPKPAAAPTPKHESDSRRIAPVFTSESPRTVIHKTDLKEPVFLLYGGSGPATAGENLFLWSNTDSGPARPVRIAGTRRFDYPTLSRDSQTLLGLSIGQHDAAILSVPIMARAPKPQEIFVQNAAGIYYPRMSPDGQHIAFVETIGRFYPARRYDLAVLRLLHRDGNTWRNGSNRFECLASPYDFGADETSLIVTSAKDALVRIDITAPHRDPTQLAATGDRAIMSPDGSLLAYTANRSVVVQGANQKHSFAAGQEITALCWGQDSHSIIFAAGNPRMSTEIRRIDLHTGRIIPLLTTSEVVFLCTLPALPDWAA